MAKYYDIRELLSYDADIYAVFGARGIGKTFSARTVALDDYLKNGNRFAEITRYNKEVSAISANWAEKIQTLDKYDKYEFKNERNTLCIRVKTNDGKKNKNGWKICGYFLGLSMQQQLKKLTFVNVRTIIMDEYIIDTDDRFHRYLNNEWRQLSNLVDTVTRERADIKGVKPRVFLLGNSCDFFNPLFERYHINEVPKYGRTWHANHTMLLDYVRDDDYAREKIKGTLAGRMMGDDNKVSAFNEFSMREKHDVRKPTKNSELSYRIRYAKNEYGVYIDWGDGYVYIARKFDATKNVTRYAITNDDMSVNYRTATYAKKFMRNIIDYYGANMLRFDTLTTKNVFLGIMRMYGVQ
jgi:hypothetical protein